jgi:hypothetical protein
MQTAGARFCLTRHVAGSLPLITILLTCTACMRHKVPPTQLVIAPQVTVSYGAYWEPSAQKYAHGFELVRTDPEEALPGKPKPPYPSHLARVVITTEQRLSQADAQQRLRDVARAHPQATPTFRAIGGWPAVEVRFRERLPQPAIKDGEGPRAPTPLVSRAVLAIAADTQVVDFDIWLAPDSKTELLTEAIAIAQSTTFPSTQERSQLDRVIAGLVQWAKSAGLGQPGGGGSGGGGNTGGGSGVQQLNVSPNRPSLVQTGIGELEIEATPDASKIVIASNSGLTFSTDSGLTFSTGNPGTFGLKDPTLTRAVSGAFYLGGVAFPNNVLGFTGCADAVNQSTDNGASFTLRGFSASCPATGSICLPDQPHIAADKGRAAPNTGDLIYAVWRNFTPTPCLSCPPTCQKLITSPAWQTSNIACSKDGGLTWTLPTPLPGGGDHPRVAVGADGKVYVVLLDGNSVKLSRFSSCSEGLALDPGFPVTVTNDAGVACPEPGLDRCDDAISSQMVAPDPASALHIFVTYARHMDDGGKFELIYSHESNDGGSSFSGQQIVSSISKVHRFLPWSCSTMGTVFVGWYDRQAALGGATNDLTDYVVGSPIFPSPVNLSINPDPQCASGWPTPPRDQNDSEDCTVQPQNAGQCQNGSGGGSLKPCDYSSSSCPSGESCKTGRGRPKYGDYNGIACADNNVIAAWASATAPPGAPAPGGIAIFSRVIPLVSAPPSSWDQLKFDIVTGQDDLRDSSEVTATVSSEPSKICLKPSTANSPDGICSNGSGATDRTGRSTWQNSDGVISQTFTVANPQTSASGFGNLTISLIEGSCFGCTSDNWNIEKITVTAIDSTSRLPPTILLSLTSAGGGVSDTSCVTRLKDTPNAQSATFSLASPPTNTHTYNGGPSSGLTTACKNNGDQ